MTFPASELRAIDAEPQRPETRRVRRASLAATLIDGSGTRRDILCFEALLALLVIAASYQFAVVRMNVALPLPGATLVDLVDGTANTPFQYRILMPLLARGLLAMLALPPSQDLLEQMFIGFDAAALTGFVYVVRLLLQTMTGNRLVAILLPLASYFVLPFNLTYSDLNNFWMPYDVPNLLFFALGLYFLHRGNYAPYYAVFLLGVLDRETIAFLAVIFALTRWSDMPRRTLALHVLAQAAIWIVVKAGMFMLFRDNLGAGLVEVTHHSKFGLDRGTRHIDSNLVTLVLVPYWPHMMSAIGYLWIPVLLLRKLITDPFARRALWVLAPFMAVALVVCNIYELRIFTDMYPVILLALGSIAAELYRRATSTAKGMSLPA